MNTQFPSIQPVTKFLLILNIGLHALFYVLENVTGLDVSIWLGLKYVGAETFFPTQFITHMFLHADLRHLVGNMFGLFFFGGFIEMIWGSKRFLTLYLVTGIGAGLIYSLTRYIEYQQFWTAYQHFLENPSFEFLASVDRIIAPSLPPMMQINPQEIEGASAQQYLDIYGRHLEVIGYQLRNFPCVGASGSIFGLIAGLALLMPDKEIQIFPIPIPIKLKYFALIYTMVELYMGVSRIPGDRVAHYAHLGGAVVAFIYIKYWEKLRKTFS